MSWGDIQNAEARTVTTFRDGTRMKARLLGAMNTKVLPLAQTTFLQRRVINGQKMRLQHSRTARRS